MYGTPNIEYSMDSSGMWMKIVVDYINFGFEHN